jgi:hypothetical protein
MKIMKILITLYIFPILIIPIYFKKSIPVLFELSGYTFTIREELTTSYFYLPVLGLLLSIICLKIYSILSKISLKIILMSIFSIISITIGIPSIKIMLYSNYHNNILFIDRINIIGASLLKISIIILGAGIYFLFIKNRAQISEYIYEIKNIFNIK